MHFYKSSDDNSTTKGRKENKGTKIQIRFISYCLMIIILAFINWENINYKNNFL